MMKRVIALMLVGLIVISAGSAKAELVADYDYTSALGADPTTQGWTYGTNASNAFLGGYDASIYTGQSGWRIIDGTNQGYANYLTTLTALQGAAMKTEWTASWTFKLDSDALKTDGTGGVTDYYNPPNESRQNNNGLWIETSGTDSYRYFLVATADADGNLAINDSSTAHVLTAGPAGTDFGYDTQYTVTLAYDGTDAILSYGGSDFALAKLGTTGQDRILFGAHSSSGQGSVVYDAVSFDAVPEPATMALLGLGGLALLRRRRA